MDQTLAQDYQRQGQTLLLVQGQAKREKANLESDWSVLSRQSGGDYLKSRSGWGWYRKVLRRQSCGQVRRKVCC